MTTTFTCEIVEVGKRWQCTDGTKTWFAGESYRYNGKLASETIVEEPPVITIPPKTVNADQKGVDGNNIYKIVKIEGGSNPEYAIDGKKSTSAKTKELIADVGGIAYIRTFALKFDGGPYSFEIKVSLNSQDYTTIPLGLLTSEISTPSDQFQYFILPDIIPANWIKIASTQQEMKIVTLQLLEIDPDPAGEPVPDNPPIVIPPEEVPESPQAEGIPIPTGIKLKGPVMLQKFKHWGRHSTNYASGGSGPSERWDLSDLPNALNVLAGYEVNLGEAKGTRGEDNFDMKFRGSSHSDSNGGWYIPSFSWNSEPHCGKEYPHPKTSMKPLQEVENKNIGNMKGDFWVGYLACVYNDAENVPCMKLWGKPKGRDNSNKFTDYIYMGMSRDTGNMSPGPVLTAIGMKGSKLQRLQIRMDEVPDAKIRNAFAVEIEPPKN